MTIAIVFAALCLAGALAFAIAYFLAHHPRRGSLDWVQLREREPFTFAARRHPMDKKDRLPILLITVLYALTAFFSLGSTRAPQTFVDFAGGETVSVELAGEAVYTTGIRYYSGLGTGIEARDKTNSAYNVEISADGETWYTLWQRHEDKEHPERVTAYFWAEAADYEPSYAMTQTYNQLFKWNELTVTNPQNVKYLRITGRASRDVLRLGKFFLLDGEGRIIPVNWTLTGNSVASPALQSLFAMDETVPQDPDWRDAAYFDEIYHARTALEHIENISPYEWTHPPLGKLIIGLGIRMFGMTPFGWRFMGTLFGVLMLPILYIFLKNLFGKTAVAACGTTLFAVDFMHLTQTRIATIDTYGVFFILLSYFFFYRWLTASGTPKRRRETPGEGYGALALSGIAFGVGVACKWTVLYAGAGLAVLYVIHMVLCIRHWDRETHGSMAGWLVKTLLLSVLCFVVIPVAIYTASYIPYVTAAGQELTVKNLWDETIRNQISMFRYHQGAHDAHPYESRWYQWLFDARPILYYSKDLSNGLRESFGAFNNPLVSWTGLLSLVFVAVRAVQRRSGKALFIVLGFLAQFLPWVAIGRTTFAYHYFPSMLFLVLAIAYLMNDFLESDRVNGKVPVYSLTAGATALYALFYPVLIGLAIPSWYAQWFLRWFPSWPIY